VEDAENRFEELLEACVRDGTQLIAKHDVEVAVMLPIREWWRLSAAGRPSLKELLLSEDGPRDLETPGRGLLDGSSRIGRRSGV